MYTKNGVFLIWILYIAKSYAGCGILGAKAERKAVAVKV
jgi:hypothetical protein